MGNHSNKEREADAATAANSAVSDGEQDARLFHPYLYCCLARYDALAGHGYQAALGPHGFTHLLKHMHVSMECFASPMNCRYGRYCSAFPDTDAPFGSVGSFFTFEPHSGSFEANPPFVPELMARAVSRMETLLGSPGKGPLSFVLIIPAWTKIKAYSMAQNSQFRRGSFLLDASNHGFCDGAQHLRSPASRLRPSSFDTAVIVLQNDLGAQKWPI